MSGFIANGTAPAEAPVSSDPFWPQIDVGHLRNSVRLAGEVSPERLRAAIVAATITVNDDLENWRQTQLNKGYDTAADVPDVEIDGKPRSVQLYIRAVACATAVEIHERYRSYDSSAQGNQRADDLSPTIDELRRDHRYAVSDFLRIRRVTAELI